MYDLLKSDIILYILLTLVKQDVTEIIGTGKVDLGFKAMIHTLAVSSINLELMPLSAELTH